MWKPVLMMVALLLVGGCESREAKLEACVQRGVAYFKSINKYPRLTNGSLAEDAARKHCTDSLTAY